MKYDSIQNTTIDDVEDEANEYTEETALQTLINENQLENVLPAFYTESMREIPPTPQLLSYASNERVPSSRVNPEEDMDDDEIRAHRYWQKWGKKTARDLMKTIEREIQNAKKKKRKELVYSARGSTYKYKDISDGESETTEISMLTCSSLGQVKQNPANVNKRTKQKSKSSKKIDWSKYSKRYNAFDKLMNKSKSTLAAMVGGEENITQVFKQDNALDKCEEEERNLVINTRYGKGIKGIDKSKSTENVVSYIHKNDKKRPKSSVNSVTSDSRPPSSLRPASSVHTKSSAVTYAPLSSSKLEFLAKETKAMHRSCSYTGVMSYGTMSLLAHTPTNGSVTGSVSTRKSLVKSVFASRHSAEEDTDHNLVKKYQQGLKGIPDFEGTFTKTVRAKINRTVSALSRKTGYGDSLNAIVEVEGEKGIYTDDDYARKPKYPQRVLIAPELSKVISIDIRQRMGRPRYHEIRTSDMKYFNAQNPPLNRSNRNLIIFNWLINIDENDYEIYEAPDIVDIERNDGVDHRQPYGAVFKHGDIMMDSMARAATAMSRISNAMEEVSTFKTRSDVTGGDLSGLDDEDDFSVDDISFYSNSTT